MQNLKRRRYTTNLEWPGLEGPLQPRSSGPLLFSGSFPNRARPWGERDAEWSSPDFRTRLFTGRMPSQLSSSQSRINADGLVTGGGANSALTTGCNSRRSAPPLIRRVRVRKMKNRTHVMVVCSMALALAAQASSGAAQSSNEPPLIVGALEHHHIQWPDWGPSSFPELEKKYKFQARVLFRKELKGWAAFEHRVETEKQLEASTKLYPKKISWFVAFDGKTIGQFDSTVPKAVEA